jgi:hypothetical protein
MQDAWNDRLSEYLDDELTPDERTAFEAHLLTCAGCRDDLEGLRSVVARARALRDRSPDTELWPGVARRIGVDLSPDSAASGSAGRHRDVRRSTFTLPQLVAASLALTVLSGGLVWLARLGGPQTDIPPLAAESGVVRPANFADRSYEQAITDLQHELDTRRDGLDPGTLEVLDANLRTIDDAIGQCREALAADPSNVYLNTCVAAARARKLGLLKQATMILDRAGLESDRR